MNLRILSLLLVFFLSLQTLLVAEERQISIGLILDCSASMWNKLEDGRYRMDAAKDVLLDFLTHAPDRPGWNMGLRIYGSKVHFSKDGACLDSVLVVPIDGFEREEMIRATRIARAIGATPLARSLELSVGDFTKPGQRRLIVFTDGEESCGGDVKGAIEALKAAGVDVDVRIIGIGLPDAAASRFVSMGVPVVNANSADELTQALENAADGAVEKAPDPEKQSFTVKLVKDGVPLAGHSVKFFHSLSRDRVELTPAGEGIFTGKAFPGSYTASVVPAEQTFEALVVLPDESTEFVLDLTLAPSVTIHIAPEEVIGGGEVVVTFSGAAGLPEEWIGFVPADETSKRSVFWTVSNGKQRGEIAMKAPLRAGEYRAAFYSVSREREVIAGLSGKLLVKEPEIKLEVAEEVPGGGVFQVKWSGPELPGAWIGFSTADAPDGDYISFSSDLIPGEKLSFIAPNTPGNYEVRFHAEGAMEAFERAKFRVVESELSLDAPEKAVAGSLVTIAWKAPVSSDLYITMVPQKANEGTWEDYFTPAEDLAPQALTAPRQSGPAEIRLFSNLEGKTLLRRPIMITEAVITMEAPSKVESDEAITVKWSGPGGEGDFITIVKQDADEGEYTSYFSTGEATSGEGELSAPSEPGDYEIRYITGGTPSVLARRAVTVE